MSISQASFETLMNEVRRFRTALMEVADNKLSRLYIQMIETLGSYAELAEDVTAKIEVEIVAMFDAAYNGRPIPSPIVPVVFTVDDDGIIVVACLRATLAEAKIPIYESHRRYALTF